MFNNQNLGAYVQGTLTRTAFEAVIGTPFTLFLPNGSAPWLTLRSVVGQTYTAAATAQGTPMPAALARSVAATPQVVSFELHFDFNGAAFPEDSYQLDHGTMGRMVMMVGAPGPGKAVAIFASLQTPKAMAHGVSPLRSVYGVN